MISSKSAIFTAFFVAAAASCGPDEPSPSLAEVKMSFVRESFFDAPFPSDDLRHEDGTLDLRAYPNPFDANTIASALTLISRDARGFGTTSGITFSLTGSIDPSRLPSYEESLTEGARVFVVDVDPASPTRGTRAPVAAFFDEDGGPRGAKNMLSILPFQGAPLRANTRYAAVVLRDVADPPLRASDTMTRLVSGEAIDGLEGAARSEYDDAIATLVADGLRADSIAAVSVFTTDDPVRDMRRVAEHIVSEPRPVLGDFALADTFDDYCVYETTVDVPDYQSGEPPYRSEGGAWQFDEAGTPIVQRRATSRLFVTLPKRAMPSEGFPGAVFVRTGGGGDRPLVDRGVQNAEGTTLAAGAGPALQIARAGFAGVQIDGPLGGLRNTSGADEQFLVFNVFNGSALRDNVRESAVELVWLAHLLDDVRIDASGCDGLGERDVAIDTRELALIGHSMGASIAPLAAAFEPRYRALVLSGAGASWIENVMHKEKPLLVRPAFELLFAYSGRRRLTAHDPALSLVQWAAEPADAQVYAPLLRESSRHVLMFQGVVDHYITPDIANALSVPLGLDLAGVALDETDPEVADQTPLSTTFALSGRSQIGLPAASNAGDATAVVVQYASDGVQDAHEVFFQRAEPRRQFECFLSTMKNGAPVVVNTTERPAGEPCL